MAAQILERAADAPPGDLGLNEGPRRTQNDEVLKCEAVLAPRTPRGRHEPDADQTANGTARQAQDSLHVPHAVGMHLRLLGRLPAACLASCFRRLLDTLGRFA